MQKNMLNPQTENVTPEKLMRYILNRIQNNVSDYHTFCDLLHEIEGIYQIWKLCGNMFIKIQK